MKKMPLFVVLAAVLCLPSGMLAQAGGGMAPAPGAGQQGGQKTAEDPAIRAAIKHLEAAREALKNGKHDFGGHRSAAVKDVEDALHECHQALNTAHNEMK